MSGRREHGAVWETAAADSIGGRSEQQDRVAVFTDHAGGAVLAVVADGLGGHAGGAAAAQAVIDAASECWRQTPKPVAEPEHLLTDICLAAHRRIVALAGETGIEGHSTCALFYGDGAATAWLHVGDSRIYRFRGQTPAGRTRDHSLIQRMLERGDIAEADMADHPDQNMLLQALGGDREPQPDTAGAASGEYDSFLLCSDGLWEAIAADEMGRALVGRPLATVAGELTGVAAGRRGFRSDNIAVVLGRAAMPPPPRPPRRRAILTAALAALAAAIFAAHWIGPERIERVERLVMAAVHGPAAPPAPKPIPEPPPAP